MAVVVLTLLPDVATLGHDQLQRYCIDWLQRPIARHWGMVQLNVASDLDLQVLIDERRMESVGSLPVVPIDKLSAISSTSASPTPSTARSSIPTSEMQNSESMSLVTGTKPPWIKLERCI
jgi:hypothetical protein